MTHPRAPHIPELDLVRGGAIVLVMGLHAGLPGFAGGYLGVDVFFVLSGFLITRGLLVRSRSRGGVLDFWGRRLARLLPAVVALTAITVLMGSRFLGEGASTRAVLIGTMTYSANWLQAYGDPTQFGTLQHTWSLAVEEQFYFVWPLVLPLLVRCRARTQIAVLAAATCVSALLLRLTWMSADPTPAAYYRFDTRAGAILVGCGLAVIAGSSQLPLRRPAVRLLRVCGALATTALIALCVGLDMGRHAVHAFSWGIALAWVCTGVVMAALLWAPVPILRRLGSTAVARWIATRSYSLYLWHPVVYHVLDGSGRSASADTALKVVVASIAAELSYRGVERPVMLRWERRRSVSADRVPAVAMP